MRSNWFRWGQLLAGLLLYGLAVSLLIRSNLGLGSWDAFHVGLHKLTGITVGMASIAVGVLIVAGTRYIGIRPGAGTLANMVLIGVFVDLLLVAVPPATGWAWAFAYFALGVVLTGFATGLYIAAGLGKGPRDGLLIGISQRTGWSVRRVRTLVEMSVLAGGWLMGGTIGIGTVLFTLTIGPVTQWGLQVFGLSSPGALPPAQQPLSTEAPGLREAA